MSSLSFDLATMDDEPELRMRMQHDWMPGNISVSFRREPDYFYGSRVQGTNAEVIKCIDSTTGKIIGLGSRFINDAYINGEAQKLGYLADLRTHPDYRGKTGLMRGYRYLRSLHDKNPVPLYFSMILDANKVAKDILSSRRCGLPHYRDMGNFRTPAVFLDVARKNIILPGVIFRHASQLDVDDLFTFIEKHASEKQFAPVITKYDLGTDRLRDLNIEDFYLALQDGEIIGVIAAWDQTRFRQTCVEKYNMKLNIIRPIYNLITRFTSLKPFPSPGNHVPCFYLAFCTIKNNEPTLFGALLRYLYNDRRNGPWNYFIAGFHENDPLNKTLNEYRRVDVYGRLYAVHYSENQKNYDRLDSRIPYVEIAMI